MTYRQILHSLAVGETWTFDTATAASSAMCCACKLYCDKRFKRVGATITRTA